jgi:predicted DCC family thiol-disulfide oxidoreductase YuxK
MTKPIFLYDGDCGFCLYWVSYWQQLTRDVEYTTLASKQPHFEQKVGEGYFDSVHLVRIDGTIVSGGEAVTELLSHAPGRTYLLWLYRKVPGFGTLTNWLYKRLSSCRDCGASATKLLWGTPAKPPLFTWDLLPFSTLATHAIRLSLVVFLIDHALTLFSLSKLYDSDLFLISALVELFLSPFLLLPRRFRRVALSLLFLLHIFLLPHFFQYSFLFLLLLLLSFLDLGGLSPRRETDSIDKG